MQGLASTNQRIYTQPALPDRTPQGSRGGYRGHHGRGGIPNRAVAEAEHIVIRGSNKGKNIVSTIVYHDESPPAMPLTIGLENVFKENPSKRSYERCSLSFRPCWP
nr:uncharacterized protein LOC109171840 [Ipomoea trifida]